MATQLAPTPVADNPWASRWLRRLGLTVAVLVLLAWAAPPLLTWLPLTRWLSHQAAGHVNGSVRIGGISLGWFSPVVVRDVQVRDADGRLVLHVARAASERTLIGLLLHSDQPGTIRVERAALEVTCTGDTSNLETIFAGAPTRPPMEGGPSSPVAELPPLEIELTEASVKLTDTDSGSVWQLPTVQANVQLNHGTTVQARVQASVLNTGGTGSLEAMLALRDTTAEGKVTLQGVPLSLANVLLRRAGSDARLRGQASGQAQVVCTLAPGGVGAVTAEVDVSGHTCRLSTPALKEELALDRVKLPLKAHWDGATLRIDRADLTCDLGEAKLRGGLDLGRDGLAALDRPGQELSVDLDLARVADRLPRTLRLHRNLRVTAGQVKFHCRSDASPAGVVWAGELHTTNVTGVRDNKLIAWTEPVAFDFRARAISQGVPLVDRLRCRSSFLDVEGSTTADRFRCRAEADLDKLAEPLRRFVDLGTLQLGGHAKADLTVRQPAARRFVAEGSARVTGLHLEWLKARPWREDALTLNLSAKGTLLDAGGQRLDAGNVIVQVGTDRAAVQLVEPALHLTAGAWGAWHVQLDGDLARWQRRAAACSEVLDGWQLGGTAKVEGRVRPTPARLEFIGLSAAAQNFRCTGPGLWVYEPSILLQGAGSFDLAAGKMELRDSKLVSPALTVIASKLNVQAEPLQAHGVAQIQGDLQRLKRWLHDPKAPPGEPVAGTLAGRIEARSISSGVDLNVVLTLQNLVWGAPTQPLWRETEAKLTGQARYDLDAVHLQLVKFDGQLGACEMQGTLADLGGTLAVDVKGQLHYDLAKLEPFLRPYLGKGVRVVGKDRRAFVVAGPLYPRPNQAGVAVAMKNAEPTLQLAALKGEAGLNWQSLRAFGCDVGPAELRAVLQQSWLQLYPIQTTLNGGKLRLQPNLRLAPGPMELVLLQGPVIEQAKLTRELCAGGLAYLVPALANAAEAEGTVSLALDGGRVPVGSPDKSELKGTLTLHAAKLAPGPFVRELGTLMRTPSPVMLVRECRVPFHLVNGRVHHRDLELVFPDMTVRTSGSVGLDGSLALLVEMPVPAKWVGNGKLNAALAKQTVRLPLTGTIDRPRLDQRALQSISAQVTRELAGEAVRQEVENRLKGLLRSKIGN